MVCEGRKMKPHKHCELIKQWADGAEIEYRTEGGRWIEACNPSWDEFTVYRIHDPYRKLKEAARDPTKQIRVNGGVGWIDAGEFNWVWSEPPEKYEIRDKPDPYAELKLAAADPTKQIRCYGQEWVDAGKWNWTYPPEEYEIRDKPVEKVKLFAWLTDTSLVHRRKEVDTPAHWLRVPSEDKEIEL